jgi:hypothetical protein
LSGGVGGSRRAITVTRPDLVRKASRLTSVTRFNRVEMSKLQAQGLPWVCCFIAMRPEKGARIGPPRGKEKTALWRFCLLAPLSGRTLTAGVSQGKP